MNLKKLALATIMASGVSISAPAGTPLSATLGVPGATIVYPLRADGSGAVQQAHDTPANHAPARNGLVLLLAGLLAVVFVARRAAVSSRSD